MALTDIDAIQLLSMPQGWPLPFRKTLQRDRDFSDAFVDSNGGLWIRFLDGSSYVVPLCHVHFYLPREWP